MHIDLGERFFDSSAQLEDVVHDDSCIAWNLIFAFAIVVVKSSCHGLSNVDVFDILYVSRSPKGRKSKGYIPLEKLEGVGIIMQTLEV